MSQRSFQPRSGASAPAAGQIRELRRTGRKTSGSSGRRQTGAGNKLKVLVQLDVEGSQARIGIMGSVDARNVKAVYVVAKRANSLIAGLDIVLDLKQATIQPEVMEQLQECSRERQLPRRVDPDQSGCRLRITPAARLARTPAGLTLAA